MPTKFPSFESLAVSAASATIAGGNPLSVLGSAAGSLASGALEKLQSKAPSGLSLLGLVSNPVGALLDFAASGGSNDGWMPKISSRLDPLMEMDWVPFFPLGLPDQFVEEIHFSHSRINAASAIFRNGNHIYIAEGIDNAPISATFYEDRLMTVTKWFYQWRSLVSPDNASLNYQNIYKKDIRVFLKDAKGSTVGQFVFFGCFPTTAPSVSLISDSSNRHRITIEFSVDSIQFAPTASSGTLGDLVSGGINSALSGVIGSLGFGNSSIITSAIGSGLSSILRF